ncbi:MAG: LysR substrate-binding domain-containing protein [Pseudomonadota bacterium]
MAEPTLTLKQLRYLVAIADCRHFRQAAERCEISQPSLSVQLRNLERLLGVQLVERGRSGVTLTPIGREVVARSRRILLDAQGILDYSATAQHGLAGTIRLGVKPTLGPYLLPNVVRALHRRHRDLKLYIREGAPHELGSELSRGVHDLILAQLPVRESALETARLFREPIYLALAADHPLAAQDDVSIQDLEGLPILSLAPDHHLHDQVLLLCEEFGAALVRDYEGTSLDALRQMVAMNMGATFFPALYVDSEVQRGGDVVTKQLRGRSISRSIGLAWRQGAGRAAAYLKVAAIIREVVRDDFKTVLQEVS